MPSAEIHTLGFAVPLWEMGGRVDGLVFPADSMDYMWCFSLPS